MPIIGGGVAIVVICGLLDAHRHLGGHPGGGGGHITLWQ